ncbi:MAG: winged helix-turn-helix transcriptional regulator [Thermoplasmatota archaeon]
MTSLASRLPRALLLSVAVFLLVGTGIGFAMAGSDGATASTLDLAGSDASTQRIGDAGEYRVTSSMTRGDGDEETSTYGVQFEWMPASEIILDDGARRDAVSFASVRLPTDEEASRIPDGWRSSSHFDQRGDVIQIGADTGWSWSMAGLVWEPLELSQERFELRWRTYFEGREPFCGYRAEFLDADELGAGDVVTVRGPCMWYGEDQPPFTVVGQEEQGGLQTVRLVAYDEGEGRMAERSLWYAPGIPYPVRIGASSWPIDEEGGGYSFELVWQLTSYLPGKGPLVDEAMAATGPTRPAPELPSIQMAPRLREGPDASGIDHPFPVSAAWAAAERLSPDFVQFLLDHPDAYVAQGDYDFTRSGLDQHRWYLTVTDGDQETSLWVTRQIAPGTAALPSPFDEGALGHDEVRMGMVHGSFWGWPSPADAPDQFPSVASVLARWEAMGLAGDDHLHVGWSFQVPIEGHPAESGYLVAGRVHADEASPLSLAGDEGAFGFDGLGTRSDGSVLYLEATEGTWQMNGPAGQAPPQTRPGEVHSATSEVPLLAAAWPLPPPPTAAGVGLLAALVGILYWLWPALKGAPVLGLFSRLRPQQVADHPVRRRLTELVAARPGIHYQQLVREMGRGRGVVEHHLNTLEEQGALVAERRGGYTCYFPARTPPADRAAAAAIKSDGARKVLDAACQHPGASGKQLAAHAGLNAGTVSYHLRRLEAAGLVESRRSGRALTVHPTALARHQLPA